ncbi:MAG: S9 family peptidase, partial [Verrucomicrobiota bacterium]
RFSDGSKVATLASASGVEELAANGWQEPERFSTKDRNGEFDIHGMILRPANFDPKKKYPVVEAIYAGPHGSFTPKSWRLQYGAMSAMANAGFIVVKLDGLGTNHRGKKFHQVAYQNLIDSGFPDRVKWIREAAKKVPQMDLDRVGLYGGSAGGQSTLAGLLTHPDFYKAGAADCGCHDNRMDKIWWNEQWMDWPVGPEYEANANVTHIESLQGALLLTVGELDKNVDPASTLQVVNALIKADKDFEFFLVPGAGHGVGESPYLRRKRIEFFQRHLGGLQ